MPLPPESSTTRDTIRGETVRRVLGILLVALALIVLAASLLPMPGSEMWLVRIADFPRLQMLAASVVVAVFLVLLARGGVLLRLVLPAALLAVAGFHAATLWPYRPGGASFVEDCPPEQRLRVMVANVLLGNRQAAPLLELVWREKPDLLLVMETDAWWHEALAPLEEEMPRRIFEITGSWYGLELFSRLELVDPEIIRLAGRDTPAVETGVVLRSGEEVGFLGLHPHPPRPFDPALGRDAQLYAAGLLVRDAERPTVVAGDLNATPWEEAVARMRRVGGLVDPRRGYGYAATYSARSWWRYWPLDHVLHERGFATIRLSRLGPIGSDHYPFMAGLCRLEEGGEQPEKLRANDLGTADAVLARAREEAAAADGGGISSPEPPGSPPGG